jgi:hypothetical protein
VTRSRTFMFQTQSDVSTSVSTGGTTDTLCKFTGAFTIGDSVLTEDISALASPIVSLSGSGTPRFRIAETDGPINFDFFNTGSKAGIQISSAGEGLTFTSTAVSVNNDALDIDFVVKSNTNANALDMDANTFGGVGSSSFGGNATENGFHRIQPPALTAAAGTNYSHVLVNSGGAVTIPTGTTGVVATVRLEDPNISKEGDITAACLLWLDSQPTEGDDNYGIKCGNNMNNDFGGGAILAQNATDGFIFIPRINTGAPSGTPTAIAAGNVAMCYDVTNNTLEIYNGSGWRTIATV